tara:strand:- start:2222 stop:3610 length:1389 start_codon:yes stop_codon:yes gene_type:complete
MFKNLEKFKTNIAFVDSEEFIYTYKDILSDINRISEVINQRALLLLVIDNKYEAIIFYIFAIRYRIPVLLVDENITAIDLEKIIINYKPLFVAKPKHNKIATSNSDKILKIKSYYLIKLKENDTALKINSKLALLLTTSGTTGSKKFVRLSHINLLSNTESITSYLNINSKNVTITTLSPSYSYGLSIINSHLNKGACIILNNFSIIQKQFWSLCKKYKVNSFSGVPYSFELMKRINLSDFISKDLNYLTIAGGALDNKSLRYFVDLFQNMNLKLYVMYGQTEASPRISYVPYEYLEKKIGSIGIPVPGGKMSIATTKDDNSGELIYTGLNVCLGYAENFEDLKKGDENNGVLYTGDLAKVDDDNFYYIIGRTKRIIKYYGNRINLDEIEKQLNELKVESACVGDDTELKIFHCHINDVPLISDILKKLKINKKFYETKVITKIPRNNSGKIDYSFLKKNEC